MSAVFANAIRIDRSVYMPDTSAWTAKLNEQLAASMAPMIQQLNNPP